MFKGGNGTWWIILERRRKEHHMKGDIIWSWWYRCGKTYHEGMRTGEWVPTIAYYCKGWTSLGNFFGAYPYGDDRGDLAGWSTLWLHRPRNSVMSWPTTKSTLSVFC